MSKFYLKEYKPEKARNIIEKITKPEDLALLYAHYYRTLEDEEKAIYYAERAFNIIRRQHMHHFSLDSALLLLELKYHHGENHALFEYREFIASHATEWWLNSRKESLAKVGIKLDADVAGL